MKLNLGDRVKDRITGLTGILVGRTEWIYGCSRVGIQPESTTDGKPVEAQWFDEAGVKLVKAAAYQPLQPVMTPQAEPFKPTGGPARPSGQRKDPSR